MLGSVVVTGAGRGIGAAIARRLLADGFVVVSVDREESGLAKEASELRLLRTVVGDVIDDSTLDHALERAGDGAQLTGWVNNAGVRLEGSLHSLTTAEITSAINSNLLTTLLGCRAALAEYVRSGVPGSIVNLSSIHASAGFPGWSVYDATKGAVESLTRTICAEYGHRQIRCNAVAPGAVETEILASILTESERDGQELLDEVRQLSPMGKIATPQEIAASVSWLLSEDSRMVNGHVLRVDGGALSRCGSLAQINVGGTI